MPEADEAADIEEVLRLGGGIERPARPGRRVRFARAEPRRRVLAYLRGCWATWLARTAGSRPHSGERTADGMMILLRLGRSEA